MLTWFLGIVVREYLPPENKGLESFFGEAAADEEAGGAVGGEQEMFGARKKRQDDKKGRRGVGKDDEAEREISFGKAGQAAKEDEDYDEDEEEEEEEEETPQTLLEEEEEEKKLHGEGWLPSDEPIAPDAESIVEYGGYVASAMLDSSIPHCTMNSSKTRVTVTPCCAFV